MLQALLELRRRRIGEAQLAADNIATGRSLGEHVRAVWEALADGEGGLRVLDQASALAMYDPDRYADLGRAATEQ